MVLLLDPLLFVIAKKRSLSDSSAIKSLKDTFDELYKLPEEVISSIDEIILLNPLGQYYQLSDVTYSKFLGSLKLRSSKAKFLMHHFSTAKIHNLNEKQSFLNLSNLVSLEWNNKEFIFFTNVLSSFLVSVYLINKNVEGYRIINTHNNKVNCEIVQKPESYLNCAYSLVLAQSTDEELNKNFNLALDTASYASSFEGVLKSEIKSGEANCHIIYPDAERRFLNGNFEKNMINEFGKFEGFRCKSQYTSPPRVKLLFVYDLEKFSETDQQLFLKDISSYDYKAVIIFANEYIDSRGFPRIRNIFTLSHNSETRFGNYVKAELIKNAKTIQRKYEEIKLIISNLSENEKQKNKFIERLNSFYYSPYKLEYESIDFWYNLVELEFFKKEKPEKVLSEVIIDQVIEDAINKYKLYHNKDKKVWEIQINGNKLPDIPYSGSKGLKYVVYLHEYYKDKTILDTHLRTVVDKWDNTKQIKTTSVSKSTDAKKIRQDINYFCDNNYEELKPLADIVKISSKSSGCYFKSDTNIILDIIDTDLPDPY